MNRILICGLGSIGQRHVRILRQLGVREIIAYSTGKHTLTIGEASRPDRIFDALDTALDERPDAVFVCNPTSLHIETALQAVYSGVHVLVEKPIGVQVEDCGALLNAVSERDVLLAIGCNVRFHPLLQRLREFIAEGTFGRPLAGQAEFRAYMPYWHPWEDFRMSYAARRDLGGGAALTHLHEIDYLLWLFGEQQEVQGTHSRIKPLGTDVDETTSGWIRHKSGVVSSVFLSLCEKPPRRFLEVVFERGRAHLDFIKSTLRFMPNDGTGRVESLENFSWDETYLTQAKVFLSACVGNINPTLCLGATGVNDLKVALQLRGGWDD